VLAAISVVILSFPRIVPAQAEDAADLAQDLTNPLADMVTVPIQMNYDQSIGLTDDGWKLQTNVQPVFPFQVAENWNMISRTILPISYQDKIVPGEGSQFGLGDATLSLFFSPQTSGVTWGVGPILLFPTATDSLLGAKKWGAGPTAILLTMRGSWTMGALGNHIWSFAGDSDRSDINSSFIQPFMAYTWPSAWTLSFQSETTYNWETEQWSVPVNAALARLVTLGRLPVSLQAGAGYWLESADNAAEGWRLRFQANFVLPR
jgi:hypothetical protein